MRITLALVVLIASSSVARADDPPAQLQADLGLSVIDIAYEHPIAAHAAIAVEGGVFGTYFLPWFSDGDAATGGDLGLRAAWFSGAAGHGIYIAPYVRVGEVFANSEHGASVAAGGFAGYAFAATSRLDVRLGAGAQYIHYDFAGARASTPFVALDFELGYRL